MDSEVTDIGKNLTEREKAFCEIYIVDFNGAKAARMAGYSELAAKEIACENLTKPHIKAYISQLRASQGKLFNVTRERLAQELSRMAFMDSRKMYNEDGSIKSIHEFSDDEAACISGFEVEEESDGAMEEYIDPETGDILTRPVKNTITKKIKTTDKRAAIETLAKMMGYNAADKLAFTDPDGNQAAQPLINIQVVQPGTPLASSEEEVTED